MRELFEQLLGRPDSRNAIADEHHPAFGIDRKMGDVERLLHGAADFLRVLGSERVGDGDRHRDGGLERDALRLCVFGHHDEALADGEDKGTGGRFDRVQRFAVGDVVEMQAALRAGLILRVEGDAETEGGGGLREQRLGIALQVEGLDVRRCLQLRRRPHPIQVGQFLLRNSGRKTGRVDDFGRLQDGVARGVPGGHGVGFESSADLEGLRANDILRVRRIFRGSFGIEEIGLDDFSGALGLAALAVEIGGAGLLREQHRGRSQTQKHTSRPGHSI